MQQPWCTSTGRQVLVLNAGDCDASLFSCRYCLEPEPDGGKMYMACVCLGSMQWVHKDCLAQGIRHSVGERKRVCPTCKKPWTFYLMNAYALERWHWMRSAFVLSCLLVLCESSACFAALPMTGYMFRERAFDWWLPWFAFRLASVQPMLVPLTCACLARWYDHHHHPESLDVFQYTMIACCSMVLVHTSGTAWWSQVFLHIWWWWKVHRVTPSSKALASPLSTDVYEVIRKQVGA